MISGRADWRVTGRQLGFGDDEQTTARNRTKRKVCLGEMDKVVLWKALVELIVGGPASVIPEWKRP